MSTLATLAFIGAAAGAAGYLAMRPTVVDGRVMATDLMGQMKDKDKITGMECERHIPITPTGAVFKCDVSARDGSTAKIQYTMDRNGSLSGKLLDATGPTDATEAPPRPPIGNRGPSETDDGVPLSGDPWAN